MLLNLGLVSHLDINGSGVEEEVREGLREIWFFMFMSYVPR